MSTVKKQFTFSKMALEFVKHPMPDQPLEKTFDAFFFIHNFLLQSFFALPSMACLAIKFVFLKNHDFCMIS